MSRGRRQAPSDPAFAAEIERIAQERREQRAARVGHGRVVDMSGQPVEKSPDWGNATSWDPTPRPSVLRTAADRLAELERDREP